MSNIAVAHKLPTPPKRLTYARCVWEKMWALTAACDVEVSGLGIMSEHDPCFVEDLFIVRQVCTGVRTELDSGEVADLVMKLRAIGVKPNRLRFWWHSHVNMGTTFSGTDEDNIRRFASDYLWSVCTNKHDATRVAAGLLPLEMNIRCDTFDPANPSSTTSPLRNTYTDCVWGLEYISEFDEWAKKTITENVIRPAPQAANHVTRTTYLNGVAYSNDSFRTVQTAPAKGGNGGNKQPTGLSVAEQLASEHKREFDDDAIDALYELGFVNRADGKKLEDAIVKVAGRRFLCHMSLGVAAVTSPSTLASTYVSFRKAVLDVANTLRAPERATVCSFVTLYGLHVSALTLNANTVSGMSGTHTHEEVVHILQQLMSGAITLAQVLDDMDARPLPAPGGKAHA